MHPVRELGGDDAIEAARLFWGALGFPPPSPERLAGMAATIEPGRLLGVRDSGGGVLGAGDLGEAPTASEPGPIVATCWSFNCRTAVPGGAVLSAAGVTRVAVRADRTRRGLLTALMRAQLDDLRARGEALATLIASETAIYGRFGYGAATRGRTVRLRRAAGRGFRPDAPSGGTVEWVAPERAVDVLAPLHERIALDRPGGVSREDAWWTATLGERVARNEHVLVGVHHGADGADGFVVAHLGSGDPFDRRALVVDDLHAADTAATVGLWRFLLDVDLVGAVEATRRPLDEPLDLVLADPRDVATTAVEDETWLRLVDVPTALSARGWGDGAPLTLAVHDVLLPDNTGVYRIAGGAAERIGPLGAGPAPDLEADVAGLAMAYLGDRAPSTLHATGWWRGDPAAARRADALFAVDVSPWCGTLF